MKRLFMITLLGLLLTSTLTLASDCITTLMSKYPYPNMATSAQYCSKGATADCVLTLMSTYPYPNMEKSADYCGEGATVDCIKSLMSKYPYPNMEAAAGYCKTQRCN